MIDEPAERLHRVVDQAVPGLEVGAEHATG
jgi:hypothetical protein